MMRRTAHPVLPCRQARLVPMLACLLPLHAAAQLADWPKLQSADPARPLEFVADKTWPAQDVQILPREAMGTPASLPRRSRTLVLGDFNYDAAKGPVKLVVDLGASLVDAGKPGEATVEISLECPEARMPCVIPITKSVLPFRTSSMLKHEVKAADGKATLVVGREFHAYTFEPGTLVQVRLSLLEPVNLQLRGMRASLVYGVPDARSLQGQSSRIGLLWKAIAGALVAAALGFWWLRRR